jgi:hypothetical protein
MYIFTLHIIIALFVFCFYVCVFFSTRARFVIGLWSVKFARK